MGIFMENKLCVACDQPFQPRPQVPHQSYCSAPDCQRERRRQSLQTDRVILMPGPEDEIRTVNLMYHWFIDDGLMESEIAGRLNGMAVRTDLDREWTRATVHEVLTNEKYIGNNVYNRISFKLKKLRVENTPDMWIKKEGAFESIVPPDVFYTAQGIARARAYPSAFGRYQMCRIAATSNGTSAAV
jgi:hypothetical protein